MKDGPFKLNLYPQNYFHKNPYTLDKPIKPREPKAEAKPFSQTLSFKPSSPGKRVRAPFCYRVEKQAILLNNF